MISEWGVTPPPFCNRVVQKQWFISQTPTIGTPSFSFYKLKPLPPNNSKTTITP